MGQGHAHGGHDESPEGCAHGGDDAGEDEEHEGVEAVAALDAGDGGFDEPVDGAVAVRDTEEVGDADEEHEDVEGELPHHVGELHVRQADPDGGGHREHDDPDVDVTDRSDREHRDEDPQGDELDGHGTPR